VRSSFWRLAGRVSCIRVVGSPVAMARRRASTPLWRGALHMLGSHPWFLEFSSSLERRGRRGGTDHSLFRPASPASPAKRFTRQGTSVPSPFPLCSTQSRCWPSRRPRPWPRPLASAAWLPASVVSDRARFDHYRPLRGAAEPLVAPRPDGKGWHARSQDGATLQLCSTSEWRS
jgi:hypothetical protein